MGKRPTLSGILTALDVMHEHGSARISLGDFDLQMHRRGLTGAQTKSVLVMLERRKWARDPKSVTVVQKPIPRKTQRMPGGAF